MLKLGYLVWLVKSKTVDDGKYGGGWVVVVVGGGEISNLIKSQ